MWEDNQEEFANCHGLPVTLTTHLRCTAEHLIAQQDNGRDSDKNIVASCAWCNSSRHAKQPHNAPDPAAYRLAVRELIANGQWHPVIIHKIALPPASLM